MKVKMGKDTKAKSKGANLLFKSFKMSPHMICMPHYLQTPFIFSLLIRSGKGWPVKEYEVSIKCKLTFPAHSKQNFKLSEQTMHSAASLRKKRKTLSLPLHTHSKHMGRRNILLGQGILKCPIQAKNLISFSN